MARILGIDDSIDVLQQLKLLLTSQGHEFLFIAQPSFLFKRLEHESIDLILMDVNMPEINGMELLTQVKNDPNYKEIPVIMITSDDEQDVLKKCFELGAADFISKPINEIILQARINAALKIQDKIAEVIRNQEMIKEQQLELEHQKTLQYQLRSLSTSMNPHFVFNSLNSIQYYILDHEIEAALDFIADFSTLMRISLHNSSRELINLEDEVLFLNLYLKVECRRFPEKLNYSITMNEDLIQEDINIPPCLSNLM